LRLIISCLLSVGVSCAQSATPLPLRFDLSKVGMVVNGEQECNDTNPRLQEIPSTTMDQILAAESKAVPVLVGMIAEKQMAQTREPIICYWPGMAIGDIAFVLLTGLFRDTSGKTTVPGADWASMMDPEDKDRPAWEQLSLFVKRHGRAALQAKWQKVWARYKDQVYWNKKEECFRLKGQ